MNQLLWYYADLEKQKCYSLPGGLPDIENNAESCFFWRRFSKYTNFMIIALVLNKTNRLYFCTHKRTVYSKLRSRFSGPVSAWSICSRSS